MAMDMWGPKEEDCCLCGNERALLCGSVATEVRWYECERCGIFFITQCDREKLLHSPEWEEQFHTERLSILAREQTLSGRAPFFIQFEGGSYPIHPKGQAISAEELLHRWPPTVSDGINRALLNLAQLSERAGKWIPNVLGDCPLLFAENEDEARFHFNALRKRRDIGTDPADNVIIEPSGWERVERLTQTTASADKPVFVAMWYGDADTRHEMDNLYRSGIAPAILDAGYKETRADIEPHNDFIMNKVLGDIRVAPFVVADFTGHRNGVYFEAGFARGLGKTVIHACKADQLDKAHFDTKQLPHLLWREPMDLHGKLLEHIRGTIGEGPYKTE